MYIKIHVCACMLGCARAHMRTLRLLLRRHRRTARHTGNPPRARWPPAMRARAAMATKSRAQRPRVLPECACSDSALGGRSRVGYLVRALDPSSKRNACLSPDISLAP